MFLIKLDHKVLVFSRNIFNIIYVLFRPVHKEYRVIRRSAIFPKTLRMLDSLIIKERAFNIDVFNILYI